MSQRLAGVLGMLLFLLALAVPALATEGGAELPDGAQGGDEEGAQPETIEELGVDDAATEFLPDAYQEPTVFPPILYGLLGVAVLMAAGMLLLYLLWQPRFARERTQQGRRRR